MSVESTQSEQRPAVAVHRPVRHVLSRRKGWRMPENTVVVSRPSVFGNPFKVGVDGSQFECTEKFRWLCHGVITPTMNYLKCIDWLDKARPRCEELRGKNLACWCKAGTPCHADVLLELANDQV